MGNSFRQTVAGIFSHPKMDTSLMISGHLESTLNRINVSDSEYLIAAQDTTYYNYSGQQQMEGLGFIQEKVKGVMQHNVLVMNELGIPLGVLHQQYWTRGGDISFEGKESLKWSNGLQSVNKHLGNIDKKVVLVQDREADIFSFFKEERASSVELIVRVHQARNLLVLSDGSTQKLDTISNHLTYWGTKQVIIERNGKEVCLTLDLKSGAVDVLFDKTQKNLDLSTKGLSLVIAEEVSCIDIKTGAEILTEEQKCVWYLLTSLEIKNKEDACRVVNFYALRWRIERLHYTLKSGALEVEKLQFDDVMTLCNALAFYSVIGWQLLSITYVVRDIPQSDASIIFEDIEIEVLSMTSKKEIKTIKEGVLALVKLVGFTPSKKQPLPGVKVLASALERFYFMKLGAKASREIANKTKKSITIK